MFKVEFQVEDKKFGDIMAHISGEVSDLHMTHISDDGGGRRQQQQRTPRNNAQPARRNNNQKRASQNNRRGTTRAQRPQTSLAETIHAMHGEFTSQELVDKGFQRPSIYSTARRLEDSGEIRKVGRGRWYRGEESDQDQGQGQNARDQGQQEARAS